MRIARIALTFAAAVFATAVAVVAGPVLWAWRANGVRKG